MSSHVKKYPNPFFRIVATIDYRGRNDDEPCFLFSTLAPALVQPFCDRLADARVIMPTTARNEKAIIRRHGKMFWRVVVDIIVCAKGQMICTLNDIKQLFTQLLRRTYNCAVEWMSINKFLNT